MKKNPRTPATTTTEEVDTGITEALKKAADRIYRKKYVFILIDILIQYRIIIYKCLFLHFRKVVAASRPST